MKNRKIKDNIWCTYLIAVGIAMLTVLICSFVSALVLFSGNNPTDGIEIAALVTLLCSAVVSGVIISRFKGDGGVKFTAIASLGVILVMLVVGLILGGGKTIASAFMNYGCYFGASLFAAYLGRKRNGVRRKKRR